VPRQLTAAGAAFAAAARALAEYAEVLREAQAAAAAAVRLVEQSTPDSTAADRQTARGMVERARAEVAEAGRTAAARLAEAAADAPTGSGVDRAGPLPAVRAEGTAVRAVTEHWLAQPDQYVAPMHDLADTVHFGRDHQADFAVGHPDWPAWAAQETGRRLGQVEPGMLAGLGIAAAGAAVIGRRRRDRTAFASAGLDEAEVRRRRERYAGSGRRDGVAAPAGPGRLRAAEAWRTRLASPPAADGTVHAWAAPEANPLPRTGSAEAVRLAPDDRQASGVVLHTGPPTDEHPDAGAC
jgi:hypothetical protein